LTEAERAYRKRALLLWPRLDPVRLGRTRGDPRLIARLVAQRSAFPLEVIMAMLTETADRS
jgi:hypothetical protein